MTLIELSDKEKELFLDWLGQREKVINAEMDLLKGIRKKLDDKEGPAKPAQNDSFARSVQKKVLPEEENDSSSWVDLIKKELHHFSQPIQSGEIVKRLLQKSSLAGKGKRFVTKAVTSKLWLLQERGEVTKTLENGRYVYSLKK